jgi:hypothetical protein
MTATTEKEIAVGRKKTVLKNFVNAWPPFKRSAIVRDTMMINGLTRIE